MAMKLSEAIIGIAVIVKYTGLYFCPVVKVMVTYSTQAWKRMSQTYKQILRWALMLLCEYVRPCTV